MESYATLGNIIVMIAFYHEIFTSRNQFSKRFSEAIEQWHLIKGDDSAFSLLIIGILRFLGEAQIVPGVFVYYSPVHFCSLVPHELTLLGKKFIGIAKKINSTPNDEKMSVVYFFRFDA